MIITNNIPAIPAQSLDIRTREWLRISAALNGVNTYILDLIRESIYDPNFDFENMDGCTAVADYWINKFAPPCVVHDRMWETGAGGYKSDYIFFRFNLMMRMNKFQAYRRFIGVQIAWHTVYKWKHLANGNVRKLTALEEHVYVIFKSNPKLYKNGIN